MAVVGDAVILNSGLDLQACTQRPARTLRHAQDMLLLPRDGIAPVDPSTLLRTGLRPAGDAGFHLVAAHLLRRVTIQVLHQQGARPHQAHVTLQHIEQPRQFVQAGAAQEKTKARQTFRIGQQIALGVAGVGHGAELVDGEEFAVQTGSLLAEEDG